MACKIFVKFEFAAIYLFLQGVIKFPHSFEFALEGLQLQVLLVDLEVEVLLYLFAFEQLFLSLSLSLLSLVPLLAYLSIFTLKLNQQVIVQFLVPPPVAPILRVLAARLILLLQVHHRLLQQIHVILQLLYLGILAANPVLQSLVTHIRLPQPAPHQAVILPVAQLLLCQLPIELGNFFF